MKRDPYKQKEGYLKWKEKTKSGIPDISRANSELIIQYVSDMEVGINISRSNKKGARSYVRLNVLRIRLVKLCKQFKEGFNLDNVTEVTEEQLHQFFNEMKNGKIRRNDGREYKSVADYVKDFKAFWHWWMRFQKKKGVKIRDIVEDLDTRREKPVWVYLTEEQVKKLCDNAKYDYKVMIMFIFDSGIRSPSELTNIKVSDISSDYKELNIRDEISKTFGRRIKLMLCSDLLKEYIKIKELKAEDYIFNISPPGVNKYLKRLARRIFGDKESLAGEKYSNLTMYDFRHVSCCYWLPRYKSESALKYRFGWKKSDKIHYYSELLGMKDTISEDDLLIDTTKTEIEQRLIKSENEKEIMKDRMDTMEQQMAKILELTKQMSIKVHNNPIQIQEVSST